MTVRALIEMLEEYPDASDIQFMAQPNYPMAYRLDDKLWLDKETNILYIVELEQAGYGKREPFEERFW